MSSDRFKGCLLGLALGDALGAPFEGGLVERLLWRGIGKTRAGETRWTDDTQMSLDLAESLIAMGSLKLDDVALRFARSYRWSRGYGPGAAKLLKRIRRGDSWREANRSVFPDGSYGNGGAMRAPVIGLYCAGNGEALVVAASDSARITHAHPLGIEGAVLVAASVARALTSSSPEETLAFSAGHCHERAFRERLDIARTWIQSDHRSEPDEVVRLLGHGMAATDSCVTAVYLGLRFQELPYLELLAFVRRCGGDVDTIGAMAGAIWGAANGTEGLPAGALRDLEQRTRLEAVAEALFHCQPG